MGRAPDNLAVNALVEIAVRNFHQGFFFALTESKGAVILWPVELWIGRIGSLKCSDGSLFREIQSLNQGES